MATKTEMMEAVIVALGGAAEGLLDRLNTTLLRRAIVAQGGNCDDLPDNLESTLWNRFIETCGSGGSGSGGGGVTKKDVNFYDYDGTLLHSYTLAEANALSELPAGPTHDGLTFQKWNVALEKVQALKQPRDVGALYTTDDGKTRIHITLKERTSPMLGLAVKGTATVDWGDGTEPATLTGTSTSTLMWTSNHEYAAPGDYVITLAIDGEAAIVGKTSGTKMCALLAVAADATGYAYSAAIKKIHVGSGVTSIASNAFSNCYSLESVTIPDSVTSISDGAFSNCNSLESVTIPDGVKGIGSDAFGYCFSLKSVTVPDSVTSIKSSAFSSCYSLESVTIPDGVESIPTSVFSNCYSLESVTIPDSVTSITKSAFSYCYSLESVTIPARITDINSNVFSGCRSLKSVIFPERVENIWDYAFSNCYSLESVTIPDSVTTISKSAFSNCGLMVCDCSQLSAIPTLGMYAFDGTPSDLQILVPAALYSDWIAATNWSSYADKIVAV